MAKNILYFTFAAVWRRRWQGSESVGLVDGLEDAWLQRPKDAHALHVEDHPIVPYQTTTVLAKMRAMLYEGSRKPQRVHLTARNHHQLYNIHQSTRKKLVPDCRHLSGRRIPFLLAEESVNSRHHKAGASTAGLEQRYSPSQAWCPEQITKETTILANEISRELLGMRTYRRRSPLERLYCPAPHRALLGAWLAASCCTCRGSTCTVECMAHCWSSCAVAGNSGALGASTPRGESSRRKRPWHFLLLNLTNKQKEYFKK